MTTTTSVAARTVPRTFARADPGAAGAWLLGCALVVYLGVKGGGYDVVVRSEVGVAVWWILALGALAGALPVARVSRASRVAFMLLAAFAVWTAVGTTWSESSERTVLESGRLAMYLGVFALAAVVCTRERMRPLVNGLAAGVVAIAAIAVLSRLHPAWFPADANATGQLLPGALSRLAYPINYWNGLAALVALGLPLVLVAGAGARSLTGRCAATAAVPLLLLCWYLTISRGGALAILAGAIAYLVLTPRRGRALLVLVLGGAGAAILIAGVEQRSALAGGLQTALARQQGDELLLLLLVVCGGVALLRLGTGLAEDHGLLPQLHVPRPRALAAAAIVVAAAAALALGAPGAVSERVDAFKNPQMGVAAQNSSSARFTSTSGNGRYQYWRSAVDAVKTQPLHGTGAGTFEFWWARHATLSGTVRNAHSLYFETLAETGIAGLALLLALLASVFAGGVRRLRRAIGQDRALLAAALAGCVAFAVSATVDWVWQIAVLPVSFLLLAAAVLSSAAPAPRPLGRPARVGLAVVTVAALAALAMPLSGAVAVRDSQGAAQRLDVRTALASAASAARVQPYAGTPPLQRALVWELQGDYAAAAAAARTAERREPTNWRAPLVLSRIEAKRGRVGASLAALRRARALNKTSHTLLP